MFTAGQRKVRLIQAFLHPKDKKEFLEEAKNLGMSASSYFRHVYAEYKLHRVQKKKSVHALGSGKEFSDNMGEIKL